MNRFAAAFLGMTVVLSPAMAAEDVAQHALETAVDAGFTDLEHQIIDRYYGAATEQPEYDRTDRERSRDRSTSEYKYHKHGKNKSGRMPPGLAKRGGSLPPGLAKRQVLPPGLAKRSLPADLEKQLPPPPAGYERQIVGDSTIVLVNKATGQVADIIKDVIIGKDRDQR